MSKEFLISCSTCEKVGEVSEYLLSRLMDNNIICQTCGNTVDIEEIGTDEDETPSWVKDGVCHNNGELICNLGYACDGCPFNTVNVLPNKVPETPILDVRGIP